MYLPSIVLLLFQQGTDIRSLPPVRVQHDITDILGVIAAWALVAIGAIGTHYALKTLRAVESQTRSLKSHSEHIANSERPWIVLEVFSEGFSRAYRASQPLRRLDWSISNSGKTVALLIEAQLRCKKVTGMSKFLTVPPDYGQPINLKEVPIAPGDKIDAWCYIETDERRASEGLEADDYVAIREKGDDLVAFGYAKYKDALGEIRESRFCYYFDARVFQEFRTNLIAPAEYHKCT